MSCITACTPARINWKPASRSRFMAAVRNVHIAPVALPRLRWASSWSRVSLIQCQP